MRILFTLLVCFIFHSVDAQKISKITMSEKGDVNLFSIELDENVLLEVSPAGVIGNYGIDLYRGRTDRMMEKTEPYTGRVERYTDYDNAAFKGKPKYIGLKQITYYPDYADELLKGKIKSIGMTQFEYYSAYDEKELQGKIKQIGQSNIVYYSNFDISSAGKLKSVGNIEITYYTKMDDKAIQGKVKSIGQTNFQYYTSYDRKEWQGAMKSGNRVLYVNGIKFLIK